MREMSDLRDYTRRVLRLARWWRYNHNDNTWTHIHHADTKLSTDLVAWVIMLTLSADEECRQQEQAERTVTLPTTRW